jgi:murein DD-endopeptidase MepM/ murein hydrolase activator NlpD
MPFTALATTALAVAAALASAPDWGWPLQPAPRVVRGFAAGPMPWSPGHRGVDLAAAPGQQALAASAGVVSYAGTVAGRGVVSIEHDGLRTTYEPVRALVRRGETVGRGQPIGTVQGSARSHCRPAGCVHWGAIRGGDYVDPLLLLGAGGPVVLLPLAVAPPGRSPP